MPPQGGKLDKSGEFGSLAHYDYGFRIYNPAIAKFLSVDPLTKSFPMLTPYQFASNTPIQAIDLDGLEAWVIHYDYKIPNMPVTSFVFDKDLINPNGVWEVHHRYPDSNSKISTSNVASFSKYPDFFPNLSKGAFTLGEKLKPPVTFEGHANALYGEVGFKVPTPFGKVGFSVGTEGKLAGKSVAVGSNYNKEESIFLDDKNLNLGGGIDLFAGIEYRKAFDLKSGTFKNSDELKGGFPGYLEANVNTFNKPSSFRFGLTDFKLAMGLGFNAGAYLSFNEQLKLSGFEQVLYDALINKNNKPTKTQPDL